MSRQRNKSFLIKLQLDLSDFIFFCSFCWISFFLPFSLLLRNLIILHDVTPTCPHGYKKEKQLIAFLSEEFWIAVFASRSSRSHETPENCENGVDFFLSAALGCVAHEPANWATNFSPVDASHLSLRIIVASQTVQCDKIYSFCTTYFHFYSHIKQHSSVVLLSASPYDSEFSWNKRQHTMLFNNECNPSSLSSHTTIHFAGCKLNL